ncbi:MAG: LysM peptidoglycan-binding domain-containing protein [Treponema sp.]|jgi:nucleoid-associated protein YgaU|nr:LysM peptidoglycan-binding domain-containing protein [Treponema sp.]
MQKYDVLPKTALFAAILFFVLVPVFAQIGEQQNIPKTILNNEYYLRSVRLTQLAKDAYEEGDYDASADYAAEAAEYARLSDEYVAMRLADYAIARAHSRYTWAGQVDAAARYPAEYAEAGTYYNQALEARRAEEWVPARESAERVLVILANVEAPARPGPPVPEETDETEPPGPGDGTLPAQYTVRNWRDTGDCFSAIAGWSWVYGDVYQWRTLYDANKDKLPNPDNPHLIRPGTVLDIPSLNDEAREGMWDPEADYNR